MKRIDACLSGQHQPIRFLDVEEAGRARGKRSGALPSAAENFEKFPRSTKRGILEWIVNAKRPETHQARIAETARLASRNERANQWKGKGAA